MWQELLAQDIGLMRSHMHVRDQHLAEMTFTADRLVHVVRQV